jgi:hypothetical protein
MAEPLSFVASVIAVVVLAEKVVTKGYQYLKAVKNCSEKVRRLMAETNVLCGILKRLKILLEGNKSKSKVTIDSKERVDLDSNDSQDESDEEENTSSEVKKTSISDDSMINHFNILTILFTAYAMFKRLILPTSSMNVRKL